MTALVDVNALSRRFDVSKPFLNRLIERAPITYVHAVTDVSFSIDAGDVYALVGESGSGKSTIGKIVVGLLPPSAGQVEISGVNLFDMGQADQAESARADIQMIFQDPYASLNPRWRVKHIIAEPLVTRRRDMNNRSRTQWVEKLLEQVGLGARDANKFPHEFSGGQRQRICIARALAAEPKLIVCDEPTSALDVSVQAQVLNLMSDLKDEFGLTYLFISHDLTVVRHMADTIGVLYLGRLVEQAAADVVFAEPKHPYTQMLFEAAPRLDGFGREMPIPKGEIPDPINPPSGCVFHPRCPHAIERCRRETPQTRDLGATRVACHVAT